MIILYEKIIFSHFKNIRLVRNKLFENTYLQHKKKRKTFNYERPVACWKEVVSHMPKGANPNIEICLAPNLVCAEAKQTAGCGDNISAAGLILQV